MTKFRTLDLKPGEKIYLDREKRLQVARGAMRDCTVSDWYKGGSGKPDAADMSSELNRLQEVIRNTRKLIEAVADPETSTHMDVIGIGIEALNNLRGLSKGEQK
jgi:hypothetical protein